MFLVDKLVLVFDMASNRKNKNNRSIWGVWDCKRWKHDRAMKDITKDGKVYKEICIYLQEICYLIVVFKQVEVYKLEACTWNFIYQ